MTENDYFINYLEYLIRTLHFVVLILRQKKLIMEE